MYPCTNHLPSFSVPHTKENLTGVSLTREWYCVRWVFCEFSPRRWPSRCTEDVRQRKLPAKILPIKSKELLRPWIDLVWVTVRPYFCHLQLDLQRKNFHECWLNFPRNFWSINSKVFLQGFISFSKFSRHFSDSKFEYLTWSRPLFRSEKLCPPSSQNTTSSSPCFPCDASTCLFLLFSVPLRYRCKWPIATMLS